MHEQSETPGSELESELGLEHANATRHHATSLVKADHRAESAPSIGGQQERSFLSTELLNNDAVADRIESDSNLRAAEQTGLWARPCGYRDVLKVAFPLVVSMLSFTIMHFCDRLFLTWYSTDAMAAVMPSGMLCWSVFSFPMGIVAYTATFVSQFVGAKQDERVGPLMWQALRLSLYVTPVFLAIALVAPQIFRLFGHAENLMWLEAIYFQIVAIGAGAIVFGSALSSFFLGQGRTGTMMVVDSIVSGINIVLDAWFIFGGFGLPAMGIEGAAWATTIALWFKVAIFAWLVFQPRWIKRFHLMEGREFNLSLFLRLLRFGGPNGLQMVIEGSAITLFVLFIGRISTEAAAATALAFSFNIVTFVPVIGLGMAISTLVGQQIGGKRPDLAERATWNGIHLAIIYSVAFGLLYWLAPKLVISTFEGGSEDLSEITPIAIVLLRFVGFYCLLDSLQVMFVSAIKGAGDTFFVFLGTVGTAATSVVVGLIGIEFFKDWLVTSDGTSLEVYWWWSLITLWICSIAILFGWRFIQGRWKEMSVIENVEVA